MKNIIEEKANELYPDNTFSYNGFIEGIKWIMEKYQWKSIEKDGYPEYGPEDSKMFIVRYKGCNYHDEEISIFHIDNLLDKNKFYLEMVNDMVATHYMEIPSFDQIIEDNKDVLKRLKDK